MMRPQNSPRARVRRALRLAALSAALLSCGTFVAAQSVQRGLYVSVLDQAGNPVPGLGPADFVVREDRATREIVKVEPAVDPMHIALLVDNSQAAEPFQRDYREAIAAFITAVGADSTARVKHQIGLIALASRPTILQDYSSDQAPLLKGALGLFSQTATGTYLLDGIVETSDGIRSRRLGRPVIVAVVTDGPDLSDRPYQDVLQALRETGAALHVVTVGRDLNSDHDRSVSIEEGTRITGGRRQNVLVGTGLTPAMKKLAAEILQQYRVTYARPQSLLPPEAVAVSAAKSGMTMRGTVIKEPREPRAQERR